MVQKMLQKVYKIAQNGLKINRMIKKLYKKQKKMVDNYKKQYK